MFFSPASETRPGKADRTMASKEEERKAVQFAKEEAEWTSRNLDLFNAGREREDAKAYVGRAMPDVRR
jgi:hypothetical protein